MTTKTIADYTASEASEQMLRSKGACGALPEGYMAVCPRQPWQSGEPIRCGHTGEAITLRDGAVLISGYYTDSLLARVSDVEAWLGDAPKRDPGTPSDDCKCGCEGDIERHRA